MTRYQFRALSLIVGNSQPLLFQTLPFLYALYSLSRMPSKQQLNFRINSPCLLTFLSCFPFLISFCTTFRRMPPLDLSAYWLTHKLTSVYHSAHWVPIFLFLGILCGVFHNCQFLNFSFLFHWWCSLLYLSEVRKHTLKAFIDCLIKKFS